MQRDGQMVLLIIALSGFVFWMGIFNALIAWDWTRLWVAPASLLIGSLLVTLKLKSE
jgi:hypothetical protein